VIGGSPGGWGNPAEPLPGIGARIPGMEHPARAEDSPHPTDDPASGSAGGGDSYGPIRAVLLELLGALDRAAAGSPRAFYDRICRGVCELTPITRCALLLYDEREKRVMPAGSHGIGEAIVRQLHGTLEETPIAATALAEDRVIVTDALSRAIPERHRGLPGVEMLACVPIAAGERWLGVMLCDRGGGHFELEAPHRDLMWALGKTAALAASTQLGFAQHERAKLLAERIALAREVHDRVIQRLFGLSLVLGSGERLQPEEQRRVAEELRSALEDLRSAMQRTGEPPRPAPSATLRAEIERLVAHYPEMGIEVRAHADPPAHFEPLAQSVLAEALHNVAKHASPARVTVSATTAEDAFVLEVRNDGVGAAAAGPSRGMGLKLAALDAIQSGGVLEFGSLGGAAWRTRLVLPREEAGHEPG
jgi:signal transduction histidine kinase